MYIIKPCHHRTSNLRKLKFLLPLHFAPLCHQMKLLLTALFFFCLTHSHPSFFVLPIQALFIFPFLLSPLHSPKFTCIPPIPLSKPFYHAEAACWFLPDTNSLPFIEKCSLSLSHECTALIASSMQLSLQSHKWKCFVGRCTSHISLKRKSEG